MNKDLSMREDWVMREDRVTRQDHVVDITGLVRGYGSRPVLSGLNLRVRRGQCHGFFGRNGTGKTTTLKCLLNHLRPERGRVEVFGLDPAEHEVAVKTRIGYVPDEAGFYPWMSVRRTLEYLSSFRRHWNRQLELELVTERFGLDFDARVGTLSKGQRAQLAMVGALCPEPELLILDEPTSGLDPVVRRELIETVISAYQGDSPGGRTILVSTHLINEFEGLIDAFTILRDGRDAVSLEVEEAHESFKRVLLGFEDEAPAVEAPEVLRQERSGRDLRLTVRDYSPRLEKRLRDLEPLSYETEELSLEAIFVAATGGKA